jgi:hypothetical protein
MNPAKPGSAAARKRAAPPQLKVDCVGVVAEEVGQLQSLFDLLAKHLDLPRHRYSSATLVGLHSRLLVRKTIALLAIKFNECGDPAELTGVSRLRLRGCEHDQPVFENPRILGLGQAFDHAVTASPTTSGRRTRRSN